ncbi:ABC transporter permease [Hymenobacter agri]
MPDLAHVAAPPAAISQHWLGTDARGGDVLSGVLFGTRTAMLLTLPAALLAASLGALLGGAAGFWGNHLRIGLPWLGLAGFLLAWGMGYLLAGAAIGAGALAVHWLGRRRPRFAVLPLDSLVLAAASGLDTVPRLVLVLGLTATSGLTLEGLGMVLGLTSWAGAARLVRARMLAIQATAFVEAARASGLSPARVWWRHALPHALQPLQTAFPLSLAGLLALESTLSFLGVGLPPEVPSWGQQLATARQQPQAWWALLFPAAALFLTMLSANTLSSKNALSA